MEKKQGKIQNFLEKSLGWGLRPKHKVCRTEAEPNTSAEAEKKLRSYTISNVILRRLSRFIEAFLASEICAEFLLL